MTYRNNWRWLHVGHRHGMRIACGLLLASISPVVLAQVTPAKKTIELDEVVVTATRNEADMNEVAATVTRLGRKEIERRQPRDEADLFKDEPDVAFARDIRRFGATRVNIRGIEDNRVVQMVDGVRMGDYYNGGGPTNYTMASAMGTPIDFLKRVEVLRGPASSLYGSDALGGVVGYLTLDPKDLTGDDRTQAFRLRGSYNGASEGITTSALGAWRGDVVDVLIGLTAGRAKEVENMGSVGGYSSQRTTPNPSKSDDQGLLAKITVRPASGHELKFGLEHREQGTSTNILRQASSLGRVSSMQGDDNAERTRVSLDWLNTNATALYDRLSAKVYHQKSETTNYNRQVRSATTATCSASAVGANNCYIEQDFFVEQTSFGGSVQMDKGLQWLGADHFLSYGMDLSRVRTEELRDARIWNLTSGTFTKTLAGDTTPARDFPIGETTTAGLFVQDEISGLADGRLSVTPGLRYDWRKLEPKVDEIAQATLTANGKTAVSQSHSALSPRLSANWKLSDVYSLWGQVVRGFRAPNYEEVNGNFRNTTQGYGTAPNAGLKPETSTGVEVGLRWAAPGLRGQVAVFDTDYKNYIEQVTLSCPSDPRCISGLTRTLTFENLRKVNIHGAEFRSSWELMPRWRLDGAIAYIIGTDKSTDQPLNSVEPTRLSLALAHDAGVWGTETRLRAASAKKRVSDWSSPNVSTLDPYYRPGGYAVVDVAAWWQVDKRVRVNAGVNNLFGRKYWLWSDIRQADARNPLGVDFYTQPGRHLVASLQVDF